MPEFDDPTYAVASSLGNADIWLILQARLVRRMLF